MVKGLLGGLTVLVEVEALVFCSTGKLQDKDSHCLIPARLQNKRESCCFIKTTRHSVGLCLCVCGPCADVCMFVCVIFFFFFAAVFILCQEMIYSIFDEVAAELLRPMLKCVAWNSQNFFLLPSRCLSISM